MSFNIYCCAVFVFVVCLFVCFFFSHFDKFEVNRLLGFVLGLEFIVALLYLNFSINRDYFMESACVRDFHTSW